MGDIRGIAPGTRCVGRFSMQRYGFGGSACGDFEANGATGIDLLPLLCFVTVEAVQADNNKGSTIVEQRASTDREDDPDPWGRDRIGVTLTPRVNTPSKVKYNCCPPEVTGKMKRKGRRHGSSARSACLWRRRYSPIPCAPRWRPVWAASTGSGRSTPRAACRSG